MDRGALPCVGGSPTFVPARAGRARRFGDLRRLGGWSKAADVPLPPACLRVSPFIDADPARVPDGYVLATLEWTFSDPETGWSCIFAE